MKQIVLILLVTLGVNQFSCAQGIPEEIKNEIVSLTKEMDKQADANNLDAVDEGIMDMLDQAPDDNMKEEVLKIMLKNSNSSKLKEYLEGILSGDIELGTDQEAQPQITLLKNVNLIDGSSNKAEKNTTLLLEDGKITRISKGTISNYPPEAVVVDLKGKYVMPGLIDAHVHLATDPDEETYANQTKELRKMFGQGLLGVRDMGGDGRALTYYARQAVADQILSPDIHFSSILAYPNFFEDERIIASSRGVELGTGSWAHRVTKDTNLTALMQRVKGIGATGVKLYYDVDAELTEKIATAAKNVGLKVWSHWEIEPANAINTIQGGVQVVSHAEVGHDMINLNGLDKSKLTEELINKRGGLKLWKEMVKNNTILDATLAVLSELDEKDIISVSTAITKAAFNAGVKIAAGSDIGGNDEGLIGAHVEYRLLNKRAGMSPFQVLQSAAIVNAEATAFENELGIIKKGKHASFLVYKSNPLESVKSWNTPLYVVKRGVIYSGKELRTEESTVTPLFTSNKK